MARQGPIILCAIFVCLGQNLLAEDIPPGYGQAAVHDPGSSQYIPLLPIGGFHRFNNFGGWGGYSFAGPYLPPSVYTSGAYPYFAMYQGPWIGMWSRPVQYGAFFPPVPLYGPAAVMPTRGDGLGLGATKLVPPGAAKAKPQEPKDGFGELAAQKALKPKAVKARATNANARARSQRFIVLGDGYFAKQAYADAYSRYKLAQQAAPDMADGFLRQGFALIAMGRYDNAARISSAALRCSRRGPIRIFAWTNCTVRAGWPRPRTWKRSRKKRSRGRGAGLDVFDGGHAVLRRPGRTGEAVPLARKELAGGDDSHLDGFLRLLAPARAEDELPAPADPVAVAKNPASPPVTRIAPFSELPEPAVVAPRSPAPPATAPRRRDAPAAPKNSARDL